ncbi:MAG TPA: ethanolamine ammonia-lyase subunit EutC [Acidobacteriaceae bacterium]|nr:ethanolamine ammonia-lyase subunit EutC [Acidobacteriaceae bacterium]
MAEIKYTGPDAPPATDVWAHLRTFTPARIGLGRVGASLPTRALLDFELAHARARDAVHATFDAETLARRVRESGFGEPAIVSSQARNRMDYLLRPDLGRALDDESHQRLRERSAQISMPTIAVVIADGLSAIAPARHALSLLNELRPSMASDDHTTNVTVVVANHARVALGDEIGQVLRAQAVVVLIGERPGLSSPDSLGIYLTWAPRVGRSDAERNCISNVRPDGLPCREAAARLAWLLSEARRLQLSGVGLKDDSEAAVSLP